MFLVHIGLIFCGITIHVFLIFSLCILHIVQGTQSIDKLLSPIKSKIFLTDGKGVIHGLVQPQLETKMKSLMSWLISAKSSEMYLVMGWSLYFMSDTNTSR